VDNVKKILSIVFIVFSLLIWRISYVALNNFAGYFQLYEKYSWMSLAINVLPVLIAVVTYYLCYRIEQVKVYMTDVVSEVKKVVWPTKKETWGATLVVLIAVIISALVLGFFDWGFGMLFKWILSL